jgi:hypothetical protein
MVQTRRTSGRRAPEQLPLIDLQAPPGEGEVAAFLRVGTFLLMRNLAPRTDPAIEALIKSLEHTLMAGFASLGKSAKEVIREAVRDGIREGVRIASPPMPSATSRPPAGAVLPPPSRGQLRRGGRESWSPIIATQVRTDVDVAAGGTRNRDAFATEAIRQFGAVMRKGVTTRDATINQFRAPILQPHVRRRRMTLHIPSRWRSEITKWATSVDRTLAPNQMLEVILRWRLGQFQERHGRPSGA